MTQIKRTFWILAGVLVIAALAGFTNTGKLPRELPPRPTAAPTAAPTTAPAADPAATPSPGGIIILAAQTDTPQPDTLWTRVQWQDADGSWQEVDGWRGAFDNNWRVTWWVAPDDLAAGPFRWLVYASAQSDKIIAVSDSFYLPAVPGQTIVVAITLPEARPDFTE